MDALTAVTTTLSAGHHAMTLLKALGEAAKISNQSDLLNQVLELRMTLLDILDKQQNLQSENTDLKEKIKELEGEIKQTKNLKFDGEIYWQQKEDGSQDGPFCATCHDKDNKLIRLQDARNRIASCRWFCFTCKSKWGFNSEEANPNDSGIGGIGVTGIR